MNADRAADAQRTLTADERENVLDALAKVIRDLNPLPDSERKRVLETAAAFFDIIL